MNRGIVLYVEDNAPSAEIMTRRLRQIGVIALIAENGTEAIERAMQHIPDLILMDFNLPDIDGIEVMRRIRQRQETEHIPVVMLTANNSAETRQLATEGGCAGYLVKPVDRSELFMTVEQYLSGKDDTANTVED